MECTAACLDAYAGAKSLRRNAVFGTSFDSEAGPVAAALHIVAEELDVFVAAGDEQIHIAVVVVVKPYGRPRAVDFRAGLPCAVGQPEVLALPAIYI